MKFAYHNPCKCRVVSFRGVLYCSRIGSSIGSCTNKEFREILEKFLRQNKYFCVNSMEKLLGYDKTNSDRARKQAYYYITKLLEKKVIRKTNQYEPQGSGQKPLVIYEVAK